MNCDVHPDVELVIICGYERCPRCEALYGDFIGGVLDEPIS